MQYDAAAVSTAIARIDRDPIGLTETDFVLLKEFMGDALETRARDAHHAAILARVPAAPVLTKAVSAPTPAIADMTFEELCEKFPKQVVTLGVLVQVTRFIDSMNENNKIRNARLDALEAANKTLRERVLELEAVAAVRA